MALLIYPEFSPYSFWNYKEVCRLVGAKYPAAPLGLITLAALLPESWQMKLVDMNTTELRDSDIDEADLVFIGGMLPQQANFLRLIDRVHGRGKKVVAGGPDPTSQPEIYRRSDYLVLGEVEDSIASFLKDLESGVERGVYLPGETRPDMTRSPVPRFDLLDLKAYLMIGIQVTRGCPFNCEFCDIIELYGRVPRLKTPEQVVAELDALYTLRYRGLVDLVDDNFIGNKRQIKEVLRAVGEWSAARGYPFFFCTQASINIADDEELLDLMRDVDFRYVFIGIESADEEVLAFTKKSTNLRRAISEDLLELYQHGIVVNGGFIIGFDGETPASARSIRDTIDRGRICMAMIGLLYALPGTQLTRRLAREGRLFEKESRMGPGDDTAIDQTTSGLNFVTKRDRAEIYEDYKYVLNQVYAPKSYFDRSMRLCRVLNRKAKHKLSWPEKLRAARAFIRLVLKLGLKPVTAYYFWRNIILTLLLHPSSVEELANLMAMYIHFRKQTDNTLKTTASLSRTQPGVSRQASLAP
ncbi:MAG: B12-binding domain-containing radical SAM protein [Acidobacteriota bacterium]